MRATQGDVARVHRIAAIEAFALLKSPCARGPHHLLIELSGGNLDGEKGRMKTLHFAHQNPNTPNLKAANVFVGSQFIVWIGIPFSCPFPEVMGGRACRSGISRCSNQAWRNWAASKLRCLT